MDNGNGSLKCERSSLGAFNKERLLVDAFFEHFQNNRDISVTPLSQVDAGSAWEGVRRVRLLFWMTPATMRTGGWLWGPLSIPIPVLSLDLGDTMSHWWSST